MVWYNELSLHFPRGTEENHGKPSVNVDGLWAKIWTQNLLHKCCPLGCEIWQHMFRFKSSGMWH